METTLLQNPTATNEFHGHKQAHHIDSHGGLAHVGTSWWTL